VQGISGCLSVEECLSYVAGSASAPAPRDLQRHVDGCSACRLVLAEAARGANDVSLPSQPVGAPRTLRIGETLLGRYEVRRFIAKGGMGEVYEAFDVALSEAVALKTLALSSIDEPGAADRLRGEVRLARKITHSNVCRILEFGVHRASGKDADVVPFLTMELLRGETLARAIARAGRFTEALTWKLLREIVSGLEAVHAAGIVHRDLKSENVFLSTSANALTRAVVMDFGLAQVQRLREDSRKPTGGAVVGTLDYMAPEQLEGKLATPSSDVYALGIIAFEMLTGRLPHAGQTQFARVAAKLVAAPPRPSADVRGLHSGWDALVGHCLERSPAERPDLDEVARALDQVSTPVKRVKPSIAAGVVFCSAVAIFVVATRAGARQTAHGHASPPVSSAASATKAVGTAAPSDGAAPRREVEAPPVRPGAAPKPRAKRDGTHVRKSAARVESRGRNQAAAPAAQESRVDRAESSAPPQTRPAHPDDLIDPFK
jgi:tRNA A-37 threonylcarbamoyl transferase component Bud32